MTDDSMLQDLCDRRDIEQVLRTYCRGIDRCDSELVAAAFHEDSVLDYGGEPRSGPEFRPRYAPAALRAAYRATQHRISNTSIDLRGDVAHVETYVLAFHHKVTDDAEQIETFSGRYLDRFERRDGAWRIAHRILRHDWTSVAPITAHMHQTFVDSARDTTDLVYRDVW